MHKAVGGARRRAGRPSAMGSMMFRRKAKIPSLPRLARNPLGGGAGGGRPVPARPERRHRDRVRGGRGAVLRAPVCDHRDGADAVDDPGARDRRRQCLAPHLHGHSSAGQRRDRSDPHRRQVPRRDLQEHRRPDQLRQDPDRRPHPRLLPGQKPQKPITADGQFDSANFGKYEPPGANQIVVVRAAVEYPVFVSLLNPNQSNLQNGNRLIMGTAAFRTVTLRPIGSFRCVPSLIRLFAGSRCGFGTSSRPATGSPPSSSRWCCR